MTRVRSLPWDEVPQVWTPAAPDPSWGLRELVAPGGFDGSAISGVAPTHGGSGSGVDVVGNPRWGRGRKYIRTSVLTDQYAQAGHIGDLTLFFAGGITGFLAGGQAAVVLRTSGGTRRAWLGEAGTTRMAGTLLPSGGSSVATIETASSPGDHTWVLRLSGTSQTLWRDGVLFASGTQAANNFSDVSMLELSSTSFLEGANVNVYVAGWANIAWTDAQIEAFAENPAVLFGSRRALVPVSAGGAYSLSVTSGAYTLSGNDSQLVATRLLQATAGAYSVTGNDAVLTKGTALAVTPGAYAISGNDAALLVARLLSLTAGSYAITGNNAALTAARSLTATAGAYSITGSDVQLTYTPVGSYSLQVTPGAYAIVGSDAVLTAARRLALTAGAYAVTGSNVVLTYGVMHTLTVTPGSYTYTGNDAVLSRTLALMVTSGAYVYAGRSVSLTYSGLADGAVDEVLLLSRITPEVQLLAELAQSVVLQSRIPD